MNSHITLRRTFLALFAVLGACAHPEVAEEDESFVSSDGDFEDDTAADGLPAAYFKQFLFTGRAEDGAGRHRVDNLDPWKRPNGSSVTRVYDTFRVSEGEVGVGDFSLRFETSFPELAAPSSQVRATLEFRQNGRWIIMETIGFTRQPIQFQWADVLSPGEYRVTLERRGPSDTLKVSSDCGVFCQKLVTSCALDDLACMVGQAFPVALGGETTDVLPERSTSITLGAVPNAARESLEEAVGLHNEITQEVEYFRVYQRAASKKVVAYAALFEEAWGPSVVGTSPTGQVVFTRNGRTP